MKWYGTITKHAREQFKARWPRCEPPECYQKALDKLLESAEQEDLGFGAVVRAINNSFIPAKYFTADGWRFVFDEGMRSLLTCERIYFKAKKPFKRGRRKR